MNSNLLSQESEACLQCLHRMFHSHLFLVFPENLMKVKFSFDYLDMVKLNQLLYKQICTGISVHQQSTHEKKGMQPLILNYSMYSREHFT